MVEIRSYSIDELVTLTGVKPRTIAFYIQQGLLPKVGRGGRRTRYPQLFVDRLKFIERVKEMQNTGRLGVVTLPRIARVIWYLVEQSGNSPEFGQLDDSEIQQLFVSDAVPEKRLLGKTDAGESITARFSKFGPYVQAGEATASINAEDFNSITRDEALDRITKKNVIQEFKEEGIQVLDGPFGPYVRRDDITKKIPSRMDPTGLTIEDSEKLLQKARDRSARKSASKRKAKLAARVQETAPSNSKTDHASESAGEYGLSSSAAEFGALAEAPSDSLRSFLVEDAGDLHAADELSEIQAQVLKIETRAQRPDTDKDRLSEYWTRAPISEHIEIAVRGIDPAHSDLVESLAKKLRELLGSG